MSVVDNQQIESVDNSDAEEKQYLRFLTAASLFDGHDAAINIMRRMLQSSGAEVIHLAHNRSVQEIVGSAIQEDVDAIAISSYQGGHIEYFKYLVDQLKSQGAEHIQVFGGGGGVIISAEIDELHNHGVARLYSPADGQSLGLQGMIDDMLQRTRDAKRAFKPKIDALTSGDRIQLTRSISSISHRNINRRRRSQCSAYHMPPKLQRHHHAP